MPISQTIYHHKGLVASGQLCRLLDLLLCWEIKSLNLAGLHLLNEMGFKWLVFFVPALCKILGLNLIITQGIIEQFFEKN